MKKRNIFLLIIILCTLFIIITQFKPQTSLINQEDLTINVPNNEKQTIKKEINELFPFIKKVINKDNLSGYSIAKGTPALSKQATKSIYDYLKDLNVCVDDEQGYFNFLNQEIFKDFIKLYNQDKDCRFTYYSILSSGELMRKDFIKEGQFTYVLMSSLLVEDNKEDITEIYGKQIKNLSYDEYGYFSYEYVNLKEDSMYGEQQYFSIKVDPIEEELRTYNQQYILPFGYYCHNIFTINWQQKNIKDLNFNDIIEYLYLLDNKTAFPNNEFPESHAANVRRIESNYFEKLVQKYFNISNSEIKKYNSYDKKSNSYPYVELCCIASHWQLPEVFPEVTKVEKSGQYIILTVNVMGYEEGYPLAFTHKITIQKNNNSFQYISNEIIESNNNKIPQYTPSVTNQIIKEYNQNN